MVTSKEEKPISSPFAKWKRSLDNAVQITTNATAKLRRFEPELKNFSTKLNTIFRECVISFDYAQNIIVIKTLPGLASAAGSAIDSMNLSVILGTLAGDDTVMVVMRDTNAAAAFCGEIKSLIN